VRNTGPNRVEISTRKEKQGRYKGREKEVAARTVMKRHKEKGHREGQ
jgi:hypothetical protein